MVVWAVARMHQGGRRLSAVAQILREAARHECLASDNHYVTVRPVQCVASVMREQQLVHRPTRIRHLGLAAAWLLLVAQDTREGAQGQRRPAG